MKKIVLLVTLLMFLLLAGCSTQDVTSYELRQPLGGGSIASESYIFWLPASNGDLQPVAVEEFTADRSVELAVREVTQLYQRMIREQGGMIEIPEGLDLEVFKLEEVHTARHYNRTWILEFNEALVELSEEDQHLFLTGLTKTLIEGNPNLQHQTNFTSTRVLAGGRDVGSYNVFHT
jgi:hypothetical protein